MTYVTLAVLCLLGIELLFRLPLAGPLKRLATSSRKAIRVISSSRISDHWKEKALQRYSLDMARASLGIGLALAALFLALAGLGHLLDLLTGGRTDTLAFAATGRGILAATLVSLVYLAVRKRLVPA